MLTLEDRATAARARYDVAKKAVDEASLELNDARVELEATQQEQYGRRVSASLERALNAEDREYFNPSPRPEGVISRYAVSDERPYVLPFGRDFGRWSPFDVENAAFGKSWLANMTALIVRRRDESRTRPSRLIFTSGVGPNERDSIGTVFVARHDQTGALLGVYEIVGIVIYDLAGNVARTIGETPDVKLSQNTYK